MYESKIHTYLQGLATKTMHVLDHHAALSPILLQKTTPSLPRTHPRKQCDFASSHSGWVLLQSHFEGVSIINQKLYRFRDRSALVEGLWTLKNRFWSIPKRQSAVNGVGRTRVKNGDMIVTGQVYGALGLAPGLDILENSPV